MLWRATFAGSAHLRLAAGGMEANAEPKHGNNSTEKQPVRFSTRTTETSKQWRERRNKTERRLLARLVSLARATLVHRTQDSSLPALVRAYQQQCRVGAGTTTGGKDSAHPSQSTLHRPQAPSHAMGNLGDSSHAAGRPATPLLVQRQWVGDKLFSAIARFRPEFAGKVARMMLEMDNAVLLTLLKYEQQLMIKAEEAMRLLAPAVTFRSGAHAQARASSSTTAGPAQATGTACSITNSGFVYWSTGGAFCSITSYKRLGCAPVCGALGMGTAPVQADCGLTLRMGQASSGSSVALRASEMAPCWRLARH